MVNTNKIKTKVRVKNNENEKYPDVGCITILTSKSGKSKMINLNNKALEQLGLSWTDNSLTKIAVIRGYDGRDIIIGPTDEESIKNTVKDGTYKTGSVNFKTHNVQSTKMCDILVDQFNLVLEKDEKDNYLPLELFLDEELLSPEGTSTNVWTISKEIPTSNINEDLINEEDEVVLDSGEDVEISLSLADSQD